MPNENRAGRGTPLDAFLVQSSGAAYLEHAGSVRGDTASGFNGEGAPTGKYREGIISNSRVPVLAPDGKPLMPTKASRVRKWIKEGKAKPIRTKLGIFAVQLTVEPSGRKKQPIVIGMDPGSKYTGIAVTTKGRVLCGFNLDLPDYIKERMDKRRERRRNRRYRKCRRRECRFLNRSGHKIAPSILAKKQLEMRIVKEMAKIYPVSGIAMEDVAFRHGREEKYGGYFSHVEIGKSWLISELEKIAPVELFRGWETSVRRKELGLEKSRVKEERIPEAHVSDAIALCSLILKEIELTPFHFDIVRRPKYSRRKLHLEQPAKRGIRRQYGGTTTPFIFRKGDYVEARQGKKMVRGWVSGYTKKLISVSDFDWKRLGQFVVSKLRLLERSTGLLLRKQNVAFLPTLTHGVSCEVIR